MSEDASIIADHGSSAFETSAFEGTTPAPWKPTEKAIEFQDDDPANKKERVAPPIQVDDAERELAESLKQLRDRALASRRRAIADMFAMADQWKALAPRLPRQQLLAFIRNECRLPRSDAKAHLELADFDVEEREILRRSAIDVGVLLRLTRQPPNVRAEALTALRSGRTLSLTDLRLLRRDVLAGDARHSSQPDGR
uniref:Uncharacterized protein n=1 Tax=Bosea sp. NBC_00436 TaxID=2969620 RepID=A0A9E8A7J5_9HYPH